MDSSNRTPKRTPAGFTLVELLISISIIALMSTLVLADYGSGQRRSDVRLHAYQFAATVRQAQNYALGAYEHAGEVPAGGWGVYIVDATQYYLFADDGDHVYTAADTIVETKAIRETVEFLPDNYGDSFVFEPPNPTTYLNDGDDASLVVTVRQVDDVANTATVTVNEFGLVDVD